MHTYVYTYTYMYIHVYTYIYIYICVCVCVCICFKPVEWVSPSANLIWKVIILGGIQHVLVHVISHLWVNHLAWHATRMSAICHTYQCVTCHTRTSESQRDVSHVWVSHMSHVWVCDMSHTNKWVSARRVTRMSESYVTCMKASCHMYECIMSHIGVSHITHMDSYKRVMSHVWAMPRDERACYSHTICPNIYIYIDIYTWCVRHNFTILQHMFI